MKGMLQVCKTYLESPLRCVSGVTGSDLRKLVHAILFGPIAADLHFTRKLLLAFAAAGAVAFSVSSMVHVSAARQTFEVVSVKINKSTERQPGQFKAVPASGRLTITDMLVRFVIQGAYGLQSYQLVVADKSPVMALKIDIEAKTERPVTSGAELQQMLQPLLAERFKLVIHRESREMNALVLTLASDGRLGPKMKKSDRECEHLGTAATAFVLTSPPADGQRPACGYISSGVGRIVGVGLDMPTIIDLIATGPLGLPMVDQTGLKDRYDIDVTYTPTPFMAATLAQTGREPMPGVDPNGPSLSSAVKEQLGFKLETKKMLIPVVVVDHIEPPTEN
jgi:bla regulator protein BlaR1